MPIIKNIRGLSDLPGFSKISEISSNWDEPISLRGSSVRRLAMRLVRGGELNHELPANCSPPPSDLDLLFDTDDELRIGDICENIRDSSPVFQAMRIEASSLSRINSLQESIHKYIWCPVFGLSLPALGNEGFVDPTKNGLKELRRGRMNFSLRNGAFKNSRKIDDDIRFHLYTSALVFLKACADRSGPTHIWKNPGATNARQYCISNLGFIEDILNSEPLAFDSYRCRRLLSICYSLRASFGAFELYEIFRKLLPSIVKERIFLPGDVPIFKFGLKLPEQNTAQWELAENESLHNVFDLSLSRVIACTSIIKLPSGWHEDGAALDLTLPLVGKFRHLLSSSRNYSAALEILLELGGNQETIWQSTFCEGSIKKGPGSPNILYLRLSLDELASLDKEIDLHHDAKISGLRIYLVVQEDVLLR